MKRAKVLKPLAKLLTYIFEHNPYEFGLIPDKDGYVKLKTLLQAINADDGWKHINKSHIDEMIYSLPTPPVEISDKLIRAKNPVNYQKPVYAEKVPGEIYTAIKNKAHFHVYHKGLKAAENDFIIMFSSREKAESFGKRKDQKPLLVTINSTTAEEYGVFFYKAGDSIFLAKHVPAEAIHLPPLPEKKKTSKVKTAVDSNKPSLPGSYYPEPEKTKNNTSVKTKKRDKNSWKDNKKKFRKERQNFNSDS